MIALSSALYQHVVDIDLDISPNLLCKHLVHEPLTCCAYVFEAEWHYFIAKEALASYKLSLLLICFVHFDLVIT